MIAFGRGTGTGRMPDIDNPCKNQVSTCPPARMAMEEGKRKQPMNPHSKGDLLDGECGRIFSIIIIPCLGNGQWPPYPLEWGWKTRNGQLPLDPDRRGGILDGECSL